MGLPLFFLVCFYRFSTVFLCMFNGFSMGLPLFSLGLPWLCFVFPCYLLSYYLL